MISTDRSPRRTGSSSLRFLLPAAAATVIAALALGRSAPVGAADPPAGAAQELHLDPAKVLGPDKCTECHRAESAAWGKTHHHTTWDTLHKKPEAKGIAEKLGLKGGIKRNNVCMGCHYTVQEKEGKATPIAGVSCESCHGAAADWVKVHNEYGAAKRDQETPEHRAERNGAADAAGMIRKDRLDRIAANCFSCHTVPNEALVNQGGHKAGSDFDLLAWSQGEVRHNYLDGEANREPSAERRRQLYVVGVLVDLEYSLRAAAKVTQPDGAFAKAMGERIGRAREKLQKIAAALPAGSSVAEAAGAAPAGADPAALAATADRVAEAAGKFLADPEAAKTAALDPLLPGADAYRGKSAE